MKKKLFNPLQWLLIVLLGLFSLSFVNDRVNYKDVLDEAESYFAYEEYTEALPLYLRVLEKYPDNHYLDYKIGRCYLNIPYDRLQSLKYLQKARQKTPLVIKTGSFKRDQVPFDVIFYLADAFRVNNDLDKAISTYKEFIHVADIQVFDMTLVDDEILSCARAMIMKKNPVITNEVNCGNTINTRFSETNPVVSDDESVMVYASNLQFYQAVFYSKKINGKWAAPVNIIPDLKVDGDCLPVCISSDEKEVYFYRFDNSLGDLYVSNFEDGKWTKVRKLNTNINTKYWESHACLTDDGKTLYFSSNRPGGYGGLDIYKSERTSGDNWGPAINCGSVINSRYNDDSPYLTDGGKRLFFTSFGHETMGGYDIFYSDKEMSGAWGKVFNPGFPVNTTDDEMFFCPVNGGKAGYIYKYDMNGQGKYDICRLEIPMDRHIVSAPQANSVIDSVMKKDAGTTKIINTAENAIPVAVIPVMDKKHVEIKSTYAIATSVVTESKKQDSLSSDNRSDNGNDQSNIISTKSKPSVFENLTVGGIPAIFGGALFLIILMIFLFRKKKKDKEPE